MMPSIKMTAPSTIIPKSMAPRESRLAGVLVRVRIVTANKRADGITAAHIRAALNWNKKAKSTAITRITPSSTLSPIVCKVFLTSEVRSYNGSKYMP